MICSLSAPAVAGIKAGNEAQYRLMLTVPTNGDGVSDMLQFYSGESPAYAPVLTLFATTVIPSTTSTASPAAGAAPSQTPSPSSSETPSSAPQPSQSSAASASSAARDPTPSRTPSSLLAADVSGGSSSGGLTPGATAAVAVVVIVVVAVALIVTWKLLANRRDRDNVDDGSSDGRSHTEGGGGTANASAAARGAEYVELRRLNEKGGPGRSPRPVAGEAYTDDAAQFDHDTAGSVHLVAGGGAAGQTKLWSAPPTTDAPMYHPNLLATSFAPAASVGRHAGENASHAVAPEGHHRHRDRSRSKKRSGSKDRHHRDREGTAADSKHRGAGATSSGGHREHRRSRSKSKERHPHDGGASAPYGTSTPYDGGVANDVSLDTGLTETMASPAAGRSSQHRHRSESRSKRHHRDRGEVGGAATPSGKASHRDGSKHHRSSSKSKSREANRDGAPSRSQSRSSASKRHHALRTSESNNPGYNTMMEVQEELNRELRKEKVCSAECARQTRERAGAIGAQSLSRRVSAWWISSFLFACVRARMPGTATDYGGWTWRPGRRRELWIAGTGCNAASDRQAVARMDSQPWTSGCCRGVHEGGRCRCRGLGSTAATTTTSTSSPAAAVTTSRYRLVGGDGAGGRFLRVCVNAGR